MLSKPRKKLPQSNYMEVAKVSVNTYLTETSVPIGGLSVVEAAKYLVLDIQDLTSHIKAGHIERISSDIDIDSHVLTESEIDAIADYYNPIVFAEMGSWSRICDDMSAADRELLYRSLLNDPEP